MSSEGRNAQTQISLLTVKTIAFIVFALLVLNPYTVLGNAALLTLPFLAFSLSHKWERSSLAILFCAVAMIAISLLGVTRSYVNDIPQLIHFKVAISVFVYLLLGFEIARFFYKRGLSFDDLVFLLVLVATFNSVIIILEVYFPAFRAFVEAGLVESGNVDWREGFRFRGVASGGGASLSVLIPVALTGLLYLYDIKYLGIVPVLLIAAVLCFSVLFIGRTGVALLPIVLFAFGLKSFLHRPARTLVIGFVLLIAAAMVLPLVRIALSELFGVGFFNYALGFFLKGAEGLKEEGTVSILLEFLSVTPQTNLGFLLGDGFYGEGEFSPWTDSGYTRMFLSVGYLFGILFYGLFALIVWRAVRFRPFLFLTIISVLLVAELKEPLLFTGYAARFLFLLVAFAMVRINLDRVYTSTAKCWHQSNRLLKSRQNDSQRQYPNSN